MSGELQDWVFASARRRRALRWLLRRLGTAGGRLGPRAHRFVEPTRLMLHAGVEAIAGGKVRALTREKALIDSDEYLLSVDVSSVAVTSALHLSGWAGPNILSTKKYRMVEGRRQYTSWTWVYRESLSAEWQEHVWAYPAYGDEYTYDLYYHKEPNLTEAPQKHTEGPWIPGDPNHSVRDALAAVGIDYGPNQRLLDESEWVLAQSP